MMSRPKVAEVINDIGEVDDEEQEDEDAGDDEPEDSAEEAVDADDKEMSEDDSDPSEIEEADEETNDDPKGKNVRCVPTDLLSMSYIIDLIIYLLVQSNLITKQPIMKTLIQRSSKLLLLTIRNSGLLHIRLPVLKRCGVFDKSLVDKWLKNSYSDLPMLPGYVLHTIIAGVGLNVFTTEERE